MTAGNSTPIKEFVLPSGGFCTVRPLKALDWLEAMSAQNAGKHHQAVLFSRAIKIDGEPLAYEDVLELDLRDWNKISGEILPYLTGPITG